MEIQQVSEPVVVAHEHSPKRFIITIIGVLVLIVLLAGIYLVMRGTPLSLKGVTVFEGDYISGDLHSFGLLGYKDINIPVDGFLSDYTNENGVQAAVVLSPDVTAQDIFLIGSDTKMLTETGNGKAGLAVSEDGYSIAYAETKTAGVLFDVQLSAWTVKTLNLETGEIWEVGTGFAPQYFTRDGVAYLLYTSPRGVVVADLAAKTTQTSFIFNPGTLDYVAQISADGSMLAMQNGLTQKHDLFTVKRIQAPLDLALVGTIEPVLENAAFVGDTLYGTQWTAEAGANLWKVSSDATAEKMYAFPTEGHHRIIR